MTTGRGGSDELDALTKREELLGRLCDGAVIKQQLVDELDLPRSTLDRGIRELESVNLIERRGSQVSATVAGRLALEHFEAFQSGLADVLAAEDVVAPLPLDAPLPREAVAGSEARLADEPVPHEALEQFHDALDGAGRYRAVLPALDDPRHVRLLYEHVITEGKPAELIVSPDLLEALRTKFPRRMAAMADSEEFDLLVGDVPPFALAMVEDETTAETTTFVVVFSESGSGVHGVLENETGPARLWAEDCYAERRAGAEAGNEALLPDTDGGGVVDADGGAVRSAIGRSLPSALEREGFVRAGKSYFTEEPVADPTTAWRAGLSLPEVHTGYAIDRTRHEAGPDGGSEQQAMAGALEADLADGTDCVVLGPPGSGKSTACKQVACAWYDADRGPVLYREGGRGRPFQSVGELCLTVDAADGHTLVVVENAVRPEADAVFDAIDRLADREDVSFLLDSREEEWQDPPGDPLDIPELQVQYIPQFEDSDAERLVEHFERTVGTGVDVPIDRLWEDIRDAAAGDGAAPNEVLLLLHRLSTYADPLTEEQTSLEEGVAAVYDDLAGDEISLDVAVLVNTLNAAGIAVTTGALYAVAEPGEFDAVDRALDVLDGRVIFAREDGTYRTVHESWSVAFLEHVLDADGEPAAAERFGRCVSALLALADAPEKRGAISNHVDGEWSLAARTDEPGVWADETVETVYALGREQPTLAPLFGDGDSDSVTLPDACSETTEDEQRVWLGQMFQNRGDYDRAEQAFERVPDEGDSAVERLLGLARVALGRSEYEDAVAATEECLARVEGTNRTRDRARARLILGRATFNLSDFGTAETHLKTALEGFETAGDRRRAAETLTELGNSARGKGEQEQARTYHEEALRIKREVGDRSGEAQALTNLGFVTFREGDYDRARGYFQQGLDLARTLGNRQGEATNLNNLGGVESQQGNQKRAHEYYERSLEIREELGDAHGQAQCLTNLGIFPERAGDLDQAREYYERALALFRDLGHLRGQAESLAHLGSPVRKQGEFEQAREYHEEALRLRRELGSKAGEAKSLANLGRLARNRGQYDDAREYHEQGLDIAREIGHPWSESKTLGELGEVARLRGEYDQAREYYGEAVDVASEMGEHTLAAQVSRRLGDLARVQGEYDRADDHYQSALETLEGARAQFAAAQLPLARGWLALDRGDTERARARADDAHEAFTEMGAVPYAAGSRRLLGRVAAETGDLETARDHWQAALDTFEAVGAPQDALETLRLLLEEASDRGDEDAYSQWRERLAACVADAPAATVEVHREWLDDHLDDHTADAESTGGTGAE